MNQSQLQQKLNGTKEQESFVISPRLDATLRLLPPAERKIIEGKIWSLYRVHGNTDVFYQHVNRLFFGKVKP